MAIAHSLVSSLNRDLVSDIMFETTGTFSQSITVEADDSQVTGSSWQSAPAYNYLVFGEYAYGGPHYSMFSFSTGGAIPRYATIVSASLTVQVNSTNGSPDFDVGCQAIDAAAQPSALNNPDAVTWTMTTNKTTRTDSPADDSLTPILLASSVQEIVNRAGWDEGRINIFTSDNSALGSASHNWLVNDMDVGNTAASVIIVWQT